MKTLEALVQCASGLIVIQCGHFMLQCDGRTVYPCVPEEMERIGLPATRVQAVRETVGMFPLETLRLGIELARRARLSNREALLTTLVQDWDASMRLWPQGQAAGREHYFRTTGSIPSYEEALVATGFGGADFLHMWRRHPCFISEIWLRHRFEKRMSHVRRERDVPTTFAIETPDGGSCPVLTDGRTNCAGEVAEFQLGLHQRGVKLFINFYPLMCRGYVRASGTVAAEVAGQELGMTVVHVGFPLTGQKTADDLCATAVVDTQEI